MAKKRVNELAREHDIPAKEVIARLRAAGIEVKAQASAVDEVQAKRALAGQPIEVPEATNGKAKEAPPKRTGPRVPPRGQQQQGPEQPGQRRDRQDGGQRQGARPDGPSGRAPEAPGGAARPE